MELCGERDGKGGMGAKRGKILTPARLSLMFCWRREASLLSSGRSVSPLQGRYGQSVREHALRSLRGAGGRQGPRAGGSGRSLSVACVVPRGAHQGRRGAALVVLMKAVRARQKVQICARLRL